MLFLTSSPVSIVVLKITLRILPFRLFPFFIIIAGTPSGPLDELFGIASISSIKSCQSQWRLSIMAGLLFSVFLGAGG